jgi:hypothetical protein
VSFHDRLSGIAPGLVLQKKVKCDGTDEYHQNNSEPVNGMLQDLKIDDAVHCDVV